MTTRDYLVTMKKTVCVAHLRARLSEYLRAARKGHEVTIMDRDQPVARLTPIGTASGTLVVREPVGSYRKPSDVPMPPALKLAVDPVALLLEDRANER